MIIDQILRLPKKGRQLNAHHIPDDVEIDTQVAVNQLVAHGDDLTPLNLVMGLSKFIRNTPCRFSDQLDVAQNSILNQRIGLKLLLVKV